MKADMAAVRLTSRVRFAACATGLLVLVQIGQAQAAGPPVGAFFANPKITEAALSPDGKYVAMVVSAENGRMVLDVMDTAATNRKTIKAFSNADIEGVQWVNDQRLVYSTTDYSEAQADVRFWPGLFAVDRDGSGDRILVSKLPEPVSATGRNQISRMLPGYTFFFDTDHSNTSDDIFVEQLDFSNIYEIQAVRLLRLDTRTGISKPFDRPGDSIAWLIDQNGVPRANVTQDKGLEQLYYRDPTSDKWRKLQEFSTYGGKEIWPEFFGPDGTLYVTAVTDGGTGALFRYDLEKNAIEHEPLIALDGYDFSGHAAGDGYMANQFIVDNAKKKLLGVRYQTDASGTAWLDAGMKKIQKTVDAALPGTVNVISVARGGNMEKVLVRSHSDVQPPIWYVYDTAKVRLVEIEASHPDIDRKQMSQQNIVHYAARDGLQIPAYLTLPSGSPEKNLPLVVLVHGGPYLRGTSWHWDPEVQFLASRGYAVLEPEFRGSTGYGSKLFRAGWKQWGLAMQDDVADGARWAIAQGIADPRRICIAGASYGGYATLMGLAKDPDLFRCGVEWVGVTDINLMFKSDWSNDASEEWQKYGMPVLVGDPVKDAEQLKNTSPVNVAGKIRQPLLMAYGGSDRRVPIEHGKAFRDAVRANNNKVEWIEYADEGHGWRLVKNRIDFWTHVEKFLNANIGSGRN
jgi:dipeptidyl aminopeptidase/acylaminoacyl peptidase